MIKRSHLMALSCMVALCALFALSGCSTAKATYVPTGKDPVLSTPVIGQAGTLRVGVNTSISPLARTVSGKIVGLDVDIAAALADSLGLKLSIVDVGADPETALSEGKVDIVMGIDKSDSDATFWKSESYLPTGVAVFALAANTAVPSAGSGASFSAVVSSKSAWSVMNEFGDSSITATSNLREAFAALAVGTVQYVAADAVIGTYAAHADSVDAHIVALLQQSSGYCIGVSDGNADLKTAMADAVATLTGNGVVSVIEMKWLGQALDLSAVPLTAGATAMVAMAQAAQTTTTGTSTGTTPAATGGTAAAGASAADGTGTTAAATAPAA